MFKSGDHFLGSANGAKRFAVHDKFDLGLTSSFNSFVGIVKTI